MLDNKNITAGFLIIGDEILSGRTQDKNLNYLAINLTEIGINLKEVRIVLDIQLDIINAIKDLHTKYDYVFTSGGIGPTHDDITSEAIAIAFNDILIKNIDAENILIKHYGKNNINEARLKMAYLPSKATLLDNPISSAPGFRIKNVFVMAGIPEIFQAMFIASKKQLPNGNKKISKEIKINLTESVIAKEFSDLQKQYLDITMGSYPFNGGTSLVFRGEDIKILDESYNKMLDILNKINNNCIIEKK